MVDDFQCLRCGFANLIIYRRHRNEYQMNTMANLQLEVLRLWCSYCNWSVKKNGK